LPAVAEQAEGAEAEQKDAGRFGDGRHNRLGHRDAVTQRTAGGCYSRLGASDVEYQAAEKMFATTSEHFSDVNFKLVRERGLRPGNIRRQVQGKTQRAGRRAARRELLLEEFPEVVLEDQGATQIAGGRTIGPDGPGGERATVQVEIADGGRVVVEVVTLAG